MRKIHSRDAFAPGPLKIETIALDSQRTTVVFCFGWATQMRL